MRKLALLLGLVPSAIRRIIDKVLPVTTRIIQFLNSDMVLTVEYLIPGNKDEAIRAALVAALSSFEELLKAARDKSPKERKVLAGIIGKYMTAHIDGYRHGVNDYDKCFEAVYEESKKYAA